MQEHQWSLIRDGGDARADDGSLVHFDLFVEAGLREWQGIHRGIVAPKCVAAEGPVPKIWAGTGLKQCVISLLDNAHRASPNEISMRLSWTEDYAELLIADRGPGLSVEIRPWLGKRPATTRSGEGLGIGALLAVATAERLGGTLNFQEAREGGVVAQFVLPVHPK